MANLSHLHATHLADLRRSGLSDEMIEAMEIVSCSRDELSLLLGRNDFKADETGYRIPFTLTQGYNIRLMNGISSFDNPEKKIKYLRPSDAVVDVYMPQGIQSLLKQYDYVIVTEGEKKAAKAVQEGFPCVAISGVWNWMDQEERARERHLGLKTSYLTKPLDGLLKLASTHKIVCLFDSDCATNKSVSHALHLLGEALTWRENAKVYIGYVPSDDEDEKVGIDDFLQNKTVEAFDNLIQTLMVGSTCRLSPLMEFEYAQYKGKSLSYKVHNSSLKAFDNVHRIERQEANEDGTISWNSVASTRIWLNRIVHNMDDGTTVYEMAYIPLHSSKVQYLTGGADLMNLSAKQALDTYISYGAKILSKEKNAMEEFWHHGQTYGVRQKAVRQIQGTRKRGWLDIGGDMWYVMANKVYTRNGPFAAQSVDVPVLPIDAGGNENLLTDAFGSKGNLEVWREMIINMVVPNTVPTLFLAASAAGLLRQWCPDSENFIMHLYSDSSSGKTTAMRVAAGLWGNPTQLIDMWRATDNGLEGRCVARNDMVLCLDEAGMVANEDIIKNSIYMIGNGNDKLRATRDGSERQARRFRLVALSTGERALLRGERFAGQEVRTLEVPTKITGVFWDNSIKNNLDAEIFNAKVLENYGFGIDKMIPYILECEQKQPGVFKKTHENFTNVLRQSLEGKNCPPHLQRRVKHYGLLLTAFTAFAHSALNFTPEQLKPVMQRMIKDIQTYMLQMSTDQFGMGEKMGMLELFVNNIASNVALHFVTDEPAKSTVWGMITTDGTRNFDTVAILPNALNELVKPYDGARVLAMLDSIIVDGERALMYTESRKDRKSSVRINSSQTTCYKVNLKVVQKYLRDNGGLA